MLPLLLLLVLVRWATVPEEDRRTRLAFFMILSSAVQALFFVLLYQDAIQIPSLLGTTGSDSLDYLTEARTLLRGNTSFGQALDEFAGGYTVFCYAILRTSLVDSPAPLIIGNILLFQLLLVDLEEVMYRSRFACRATTLGLAFLAFHGALIWTSIRVLKDVLFYVLFLEAFLATLDLPRRRLRNLFRIALACAWLAFIRPFSFVLVLAVSAAARMIQDRDLSAMTALRRTALALLLVAGVLTVGAFTFRDALSETITGYVQTAAVQAVQDAESLGSRSADLFDQPLHVMFAVGVVRFFLLPVPSTVLLAHNEFATYTVLVFFGSLLGFVTLAYACRSLLQPGKLIREGRGPLVALAVMALGTSLTYIMLFSGNAEARHRLPFYVAFALLAADRLGHGRVSRSEHLLVAAAAVSLNGLYFLMT